MRKFFSLLFIVAITFSCSTNLFAQQMPPAPVDSCVRTGKLPNGLTYYIRHNEFPKGQVDFHIAQKVGSVQEEESQRGLAHFLEHMCFNGTDNFPGNNLVSWLESKGIKFGAHLNAYTAADRTVYMIKNAPAKTSVIDSCLLILHDWADGLTLSTKEIDKERGVIHEEWRLGNAFVRLLEKNSDKLYPGSHYANRLPIGTMEVVDNFKPEVLRAYYEKWYRPDLQGIIVVGDINVDQIEAQIKSIFSPIKEPANPAKFEYYPVPDNDSTIYVAQSDKEMPAALYMIMLKYDGMPREMNNTDAAYLNDFMENTISTMINERLSDIKMKPNAPFGGGGVYFGDYLISSTKKAVNFQISINDKGNDSALRGILLEIKRIKDYGFTQSEYDRARDEYMSRLEKAYTNRSKEKNDTYAQEYISNFLDNRPMSGIAHEYQLVKQVSGMVPLNAINAQMKELFSGKNMVIIATGPDKADFVLPTEAQMKKIVAEVDTTKLEPLADNAVKEPLISQMPKAGKIVKQSPSKFGFTELILSNGAKVYMKKTNFKDNEIILDGWSRGGAALYKTSDYPSLAMINVLWDLNGVDKFTTNDLEKMNSGKQVSLSLSVNNYSEGISGSTTPKDVETMMQLLYLNVAKPRYDKVGFEAVKQMASSAFKNQAQSPEYVFQDSLSNITYSHNPKAQIIGMTLLNKMDYDRMSQIVKERFANIGDFTFTIVGNFDEPTMKKYVEQYIASLPGNGKKKEATVNDGLALRKGTYKESFNHKSENNLAMLAMTWSANIPYSPENKIKASVAGQLMSTQLLESVREDEGAAYSPYARGSQNKTYDSKVNITSSFGLNPDKADKSIQLTINALEGLAKNVKVENLNKVKEYMLKQIDENEHENDYWNSVMRDFDMNNIDINSNYRSIIKGLTPESMQQFIQQVISQGNRSTVIMMPEKK